ncbi:MAG: hypothetical protein IKF83_04820 [Clostridia bacterium]|nr:hypothetical protein [Clostridia bacterium]
MPTNKKAIIGLIIAIIWACLIFIMSSMDSIESNGKSKSTINKAIETTMETTNDLGITDKHPSENKMKQVIGVIFISFIFYLKDKRHNLKVKEEKITNTN